MVYFWYWGEIWPSHFSDRFHDSPNSPLTMIKITASSVSLLYSSITPGWKQSFKKNKTNLDRERDLIFSSVLHCSGVLARNTDVISLFFLKSASAFSYRWFSADGRLFCARRRYLSTLLCVTARLWVLWGRVDGQWEKALDGACPLWYLRYTRDHRRELTYKDNFFTCSFKWKLFWNRCKNISVASLLRGNCVLFTCWRKFGNPQRQNPVQIWVNTVLYNIDIYCLTAISKWHWQRSNWVILQNRCVFYIHTVRVKLKAEANISVLRIIYFSIFLWICLRWPTFFRAQGKFFSVVSV